MKIITLDLDIEAFGDGAFYYARNLKELNAPKATTFGKDAFCNAGDLEELKNRREVR